MITQSGSHASVPSSFANSTVLRTRCIRSWCPILPSISMHYSLRCLTRSWAPTLLFTMAQSLRTLSLSWTEPLRTRIRSSSKRHGQDLHMLSTIPNLILPHLNPEVVVVLSMSKHNIAIWTIHLAPWVVSASQAQHDTHPCVTHPFLFLATL